MSYYVILCALPRSMNSSLRRTRSEARTLLSFIHDARSINIPYLTTQRIIHTAQCCCLRTGSCSKQTQLTRARFMMYHLKSLTYALTWFNGSVWNTSVVCSHHVSIPSIKRLSIRFSRFEGTPIEKSLSRVTDQADCAALRLQPTWSLTVARRL